MMNKNTLMNNLRRLERGEYNKQALKVVEIYDEVSREIPNAYISGGCISDCIFEMDFYDVDVFCYYKDVPNYKEYLFENSSVSGMVGCKVVTIGGEKIDIVLVDKEVKKFISENFDINIKKGYFNGKFVFLKECVRDIRRKVVSISNVRSATNYFRLVRAIKKYGLKPKKRQLEGLRNYVSYVTKSNSNHYYSVSNKYAEELLSFIMLNKRTKDNELAAKLFMFKLLVKNKHNEEYTIFKMYAIAQLIMLGLFALLALF